MAYVRVKQKYQITIPTSVREQVGLREGDTLETKVEDGHIVLIPQQMSARTFGRSKTGRKNPQTPLSSYLGAAKGLYRSKRDVDAYIRKQRDEWQG